MKNKEEIIKKIKENLPFLKEIFNVKIIGLFGSYVRGEQREESDVDILVDFLKPIGFFKFIELENYLIEKLEIKVDLIPIDSLKSLIKPYILKEVIYV
ncbi:hypothetical protein ES706_04194 [subsurface metagenome]